MKIFLFVGRLLSGILAITSGIVTLAFNDVTYTILNEMPVWGKCLFISLSIIIGIFLIASIIYDAIKIYAKDCHTHRFKYQSKKFIDYFTKWYSKPGTLSIICDDLDWIKTDKCNSIYNQLLSKSEEQKLNLYLGNGYNSAIVLELKRAGAKIFHAPHNIIQYYTFSCLEVMGNAASRIIVRTKHNDDRDFVIFDEINNTYVTELLNAFLETSNMEIVT